MAEGGTMFVHPLGSAVIAGRINVTILMADNILAFPKAGTMVAPTDVNSRVHAIKLVQAP